MATWNISRLFHWNLQADVKRISSYFSRRVWAPTFWCCSHVPLIRSSLTIMKAIFYDGRGWMFRFAIFAWFSMKMSRKTLFCTVLLYDVLIYIHSVGLCACGSDFYIYIYIRYSFPCRFQMFCTCHEGKWIPWMWSIYAICYLLICW